MEPSSKTSPPTTSTSPAKSPAFSASNASTAASRTQDPVPGDEGIPTFRNFHFSNIHVSDVPNLVDATSLHPRKPLTGFTLTNVTGTCQKGIFLSNVKDAVFRNINVTGYTGSLFNTYNSTGIGIKDAAKIEGPKIPDDIPTPAEPYKLH